MASPDQPGTGVGQWWGERAWEAQDRRGSLEAAGAPVVSTYYSPFQSLFNRVPWAGDVTWPGLSVHICQLGIVRILQ